MLGQLLDNIFKTLGLRGVLIIDNMLSGIRVWFCSEIG
jgi:hypothetical protein